MRSTIRIKMAQNIAVGIDIGTSQVKVVVAEKGGDGSRSGLKILGKGIADSRGLRHGSVMSQADVTKSVQAAVAQAEKTSGLKIRKAYISVGGIGVESVIASGSAIVSRADSEITDLDVKKAFESAEESIPPTQTVNRKIIHAIPLEYRLDGKTVHSARPVGMKGVKLEIRSLFITCVLQDLQNLIASVEDADIDVIDVMAAPLAAGLVTLTKAQKIAGCVLCNIGAETVSIAVFENNIPVSLEVFPIGSTDITNDIALGFKIPLEEAEQIKLGGITATAFPRKKLEEIIEARLSDIFELIEAHLKKLGRSGMLPAGIIITGGASGINSVEEMAKAALHIPSKVGLLSFGSTGENRHKEDMGWAVAIGLCILSLSQEDSSGSYGTRSIKEIGGSIVSWFKQFLP